MGFQTVDIKVLEANVARLTALLGLFRTLLYENWLFQILVARNIQALFSVFGRLCPELWKITVINIGSWKVFQE